MSADALERAPAPEAGRRRLALLRAIAGRGGRLRPKPSPQATNGYDFGILDAELHHDLEFLAGHDYLEREFLDRVNNCPRCSSHHLNLREVCPACGSANHADEPLLHHFRCGYVGRISEFESAREAGGRTCPKCDRALRHLGTDYDRLGKTSHCRDCGTSFQEPPVSALCLACGQRTPAEDLLAVDIDSYALTSLGSAAVRRGALFEAEGEFLFFGGLQVYRRSVILELIRQETNRLRRFEGVFSLLLVRFAQRDTGDAQAFGDEERVVSALTDTVRACDLVGQLTAQAFVACLPQTSEKGAKRLRERFFEQIETPHDAIDTLIVEVSEPADVIARLEAWARGQ